MSRTIYNILPAQAEMKSTTCPQPTRTSDASGARLALAYDAATDEAAYWVFFAPQNLTTPLTLLISYIMASATANAIIMDATLEAVTSGDAAPDFDTAESLDTANTSAADTVPGTAGLLKQVSITLTNNDAIAAGDICRLRIRRVGSSGSDTATGDLLFMGAELRDAL